MNTLSINTRLEITSNMEPVMQPRQSKSISAAEVWFIQRQKRARVQRRFIL